MANFNDALRFLRGNRFINYEQLGLKFRLYSCEVLFNRGLCSIYLQQKEVGMEDLHVAAKEKEKPDHDVIDEAIGEQAEVNDLDNQIAEHGLICGRVIPSSRSPWEQYTGQMLPR